MNSHLLSTILILIMAIFIYFWMNNVYNTPITNTFNNNNKEKFNTLTQEEYNKINNDIKNISNSVSKIDELIYKYQTYKNTAADIKNSTKPTIANVLSNMYLLGLQDNIGKLNAAAYNEFEKNKILTTM